MDQSPQNDRPAVRHIVVTDEDAGQRIDNFLARHLKGVPKSRIYRILRRGEVRVNSGRVQPQYKIQAGDSVRIPPVRIAAETPVPATAGRRLNLANCILFENSRVLVLNKPSGVAVHGGSGLSYGIIEALRAERPQAPFLELAHRLDRETSGCLVIAKRRSFLRIFHEQLRHNQVVKKYLALVTGTWSGGKRIVDAPLRKHSVRGGERMVTVDSSGKQAITIFTPVSHYPGATLVEATLKTGRTHQIRVHALHMGHPLAGDEKYGDPACNRELRSRGLRRLFLHAHLLEFMDTADEQVITVSAPLDRDLKYVLDQLEA
ncbi:MAG: 23S rRNA pseudouridine(955/2504/2580) synthase RluC [Gammaproteobacteria bacterium]